MLRCFFNCVALVIMIFLAGCASKYGPQKTVVRYYPACYQPIKDLREREYKTPKGAATGGAIGSISGALIGAISGSWRGVATGAATGVIGGATAGGMYAGNQKDAEETKQLAAYLEEIDGDISNLDLPKAAAKVSLMCYDKKFKTLVTDIKERKLDLSQAQERFTEISDGRNEAFYILGEPVTEANDLKKEYNAAFKAK